MKEKMHAFPKTINTASEAPAFVGASLKPERPAAFFPAFCRYATVCCYVFGVLLLFDAMIPTAVHSTNSFVVQAVTTILSFPFTALLGGFLFPLAFVWLFSIKKRRLICWLIAGAVFLALLLLFLPDLLTGIQLVQAVLINQLNQLFGLAIPIWEIQNPTFNGLYHGVLVFYAVLAALLSFTASWIVVKLQRLWPFLLLTLPFMAGTYYLVEETADLSFVLLSLSVAGAFAVAIYRIPHQHTRRKKKEQIVYGSTSAPMALMACACVSVLIIGQIYPRADYTRPEPFRMLMTNPGEFFEELFDGWGNEASGGLSGGTLGMVDRVVYTEEEQLIISGGVADPFRPFLLKGYTGAQYDGHNFREAHIPELERLERELASYDDQTSLYELLQPGTSMLEYALGSSRVASLEIENVGASKRYVYLPYWLCGVTQTGRTLSPLEADGDRGVNQTGAFSEDVYYVYAQLFGSQNVLNHLSADEAERLDTIADSIVISEEYEALIAQYTALAQQYYTELPDDGRYDWAVPYFEDADSLSEIFNTVYSLVRSETQYTLSPGRTPNNQDFVNYFLQESKRGYCTHYAASTVILFRLAGIPARYAEGYSVSMEDVEGDTAVIRDSNAHAWAEIYLEGIGWIPVDFTPADRNTQPESSEAESSSEISNESSELPTSSEEAGESSELPSEADPESSVSESPGGRPETDARIDSSTLLRLFVVLLAVLGAAGIAAGGVRIRKGMRDRMRAESQKVRTAKDVCDVYRDCLALLRFYGLTEKPGETSADFAARVDASFPLESLSFARITRTAEQARFSKETPSIESRAELPAYYRMLRRRILNELRGFKRLRFVWFDAL